MVRNVATPPRTSVRRDAPRSESDTRGDLDTAVAMGRGIVPTRPDGKRTGSRLAGSHPVDRRTAGRRLATPSPRGPASPARIPWTGGPPLRLPPRRRGGPVLPTPGSLKCFLHPITKRQLTT